MPETTEQELRREYRLLREDRDQHRQESGLNFENLQKAEARIKLLEEAGGLTKEALLIDRKNAENARDQHIKVTRPLRTRVVELEGLLRDARHTLHSAGMDKPLIANIDAALPKKKRVDDGQGVDMRHDPRDEWPN